MDANKVKGLFGGGIAPVGDDTGEKLLAKAIAGHNTMDMYQALNQITYFDQNLTPEYKASALSPFSYRKQIEGSGIPMYVRVGWQDSATVNGAIERFLTYSNRQTLVIGPLSHGGSYFHDPFLQKDTGRQELEKAQAEEVVAFFVKYLKAENGKKEAEGNIIGYYTFGEGKWKTTDTWPVKGFENRRLYFKSGYGLSGSRPEEDKKLLVYTSEALTEDVEITGVPVVTLKLSSTAEDGAFYVYLQDVAPDGKVTYITEGELRAIHRKVTEEDQGHAILGPKHSFAEKDGEPLVPGENTEIKIGMQATSVLLERGHCIRIAIAGHDCSNFRKIAEADAPVISVQRNAELSSFVELPTKTVTE